MKTLLFALASILFLQSVTARSVALDDTKKTCEDYLKAETCAQLRNIAKIFHENVQVVNDAVVEAYNKHKENAQDIIKYVREYMVQRATNFKCEDVLSADQCKTLATQAAKFKVNAADLLEDIKEAVARGQMHGVALYQKSVEIMLTKLEQARNLTCEQLIDADTCTIIKDYARDLRLNYDKYMKAVIDAYSKGITNVGDFLKDVRDYMTNEGSCDDLLGKERCDQLRAVASKFHENVQIVNKAVVAAYFQNKKTVTDTMNFVRNYLIQKANNFKCEDVLDASVCKVLTEQAQKFNVTAAELLEDIKEAVAIGQSRVKDLYERTVEIMLTKLEQAKKLTCEQLIDANTCLKIKDWQNKLGMKGDEFMKAAIDAYSKGLTHAKDFLADAKKFLIDELSCEKVIGETNCNYLRTVAGPKFTKAVNFLKEKYANGVKSVSELFKAARKWVWDNIFSDEEMEDLMMALDKF